jgi:hypothetical protein
MLDTIDAFDGIAERAQSEGGSVNSASGGPRPASADRSPGTGVDSVNSVNSVSGAAAGLLRRLHENGVSIVLAGAETGRDEPASRLTPADVHAVRAAKGDIIAIVKYRDAQHVVGNLIARGLDASQEECRRALAALERATAAIGEPTATRLRHGFAVEWFAERGVCAWCGEPGPYHDPAERG